MSADAPGWLVRMHSRFQTIDDGQRFSLVLNGAIDLFLAAIFLFTLWKGANEDRSFLMFWAPFLGIVLFYRYRQMQERWHR